MCYYSPLAYNLDVTMNNLKNCSACEHHKTCIVRIKLKIVLDGYSSYFEKGYYSHINRIASSCINYLNLKRPELYERVLPLATQERIAIEKAMQRYQHNREHVARALGIGERTLYRKLKIYKEQGDVK